MRTAPPPGVPPLTRPTALPAWALAVLMLAATALTGAGMVGSGQSASAAVPTISATTWYQLVNWRSRDALEVAAASTAAGAPLVQQSATGSPQQQYRFVALGGGFYELRARHSAMAVGIDAALGSRATQRTAAGPATQQFSLAAGSSGRIKLINRASGHALQVVGASKVDGTRLDQAKDTNATHQQWTLVPLGSIAPEQAAPAPAPVDALTLTYLYPLLDPIAPASAVNAGARRLIGVATGHVTVSGVELPSPVCVPSGVEVIRTAGLGEADVPAWLSPGASLPAGVTVASVHNPLEHYGVASACEEPTLAEDTTPDEVTPLEPAPGSAPAPVATAPAATALSTTTEWPTATRSQLVSSTIKVTGTFDGALTRYYGISSGDQAESQPPMFELADGATIKNVILGTGAGDGIHCRGTCRVENVWWEDVGEDAATFKGTLAAQTMTVVGGGARKAADKVFQHNGPGTFVIRGFQAEDFGKLYRSCGNCSKQYARTVIVEDVTVTAPAKAVVGINSNLGDRATLSGLTVVGDPYRKLPICEEYKGVTSGEPVKIASGPSLACGYTPSDITYR